MLQKIKLIASVLSHHHIKSYYVGGCVRDEIMGITSDDVDICLVGVTNPRQVEEILLEHCQSVTPLVGQKFPVWIADIDGYKVDFAMARKETLVGGTRKDFDVVTEGVTIEEDLRRRDFTMNSIAKDCLTGEYVDPFDGRSDIEDKLLSPTSGAFAEDTLRVYRAARFLARFPDFGICPSLYDMCPYLKPDDISAERVGIEFKKAMEQGVKPSRFFWFLKIMKWLPYHFKELHDCIDVPQSPKHHPEGDVYQHTMYALDEATDWFTRTVMVCHDLGKVTTTTYGEFSWNNLLPELKEEIIKEPRWPIRSIGHEEAGKQLTRDMLTRIHLTDHRTIRQIETLVELHMIRTGVSEKVVRRTLRRLMEKHLTYDQLVEVCRCDLSGRPPLAKYTPDIGQHRAKELLDEDAMTPIVTGEKLIAIGYTPGKTLGHLINKGLEWQDRGTLNHYNWIKMIEQYKPKKEEV
jgi:tRNA nucleotidyltransferase (CCA-adding enzyme)